MADFGIGEGIALAGLVTSAAAAGVSAYSSYQQQNAANAANAYNQQVAQDQASQATQLGVIQAEENDQQTQQLIGQQKAAYAAAGVDVNSGSPLTVTSQTAGFGALDSLAIKQNDAEQAWGYTNAANLDGMKFVNPLETAGLSLLSSSSQVGSKVGGLYQSGAFSNGSKQNQG